MVYLEFKRFLFLFVDGDNVEKGLIMSRKFMK